MGPQRRQRRRTVRAVKVSRKAERDCAPGVHREVGIAPSLIAEQRMPGLVGRKIGQLHRGQKRIEQTQEGGALAVDGEDRFDAVQRLLKPRGLKIASIVKETDRLAQV
jgi:hypothetical protein